MSDVEKEIEAIARRVVAEEIDRAIRYGEMTAADSGKAESLRAILGGNEGDEAARREDFLTVKEAACFLRVSPRAIYEHVQKKRIPHHRAGNRLLFRRQELLEWTQVKQKLPAPGAT